MSYGTVMYGGAPPPREWPVPRPPEQPLVPHQPSPRDIDLTRGVWPEDVARQLRELREMVADLRRARVPGEDALDVVRRVVATLIASHPGALAAIEEEIARAKEGAER